MTTHAEFQLTADAYLRIERTAEWKSEYIDGEMFAMSGASPRHVLIATNLARELGNELREGPCTTYSADLRVATDRHRHYRVHVELYTRQPNEAWVMREWNDAGATIELSSLRCNLAISGIYAKVTFGDESAS